MNLYINETPVAPVTEAQLKDIEEGKTITINIMNDEGYMSDVACVHRLGPGFGVMSYTHGWDMSLAINKLIH